jgi:hypothetical protein
MFTANCLFVTEESRTCRSYGALQETLEVVPGTLQTSRSYGAIIAEKKIFRSTDPP